MKIKEILVICLIVCFLFSFQAVMAEDVQINKTHDALTTGEVDVVKKSSDLSSNSIPDNGEILKETEGSFSQLSGDINTGGSEIILDKNYSYVSTDSADGIDIPDSVTKIDGQGKVVIDGKNQARIFNIAGNSNVILTGITFINAQASGNGGAISCEGKIYIDNCNFINNVAVLGDGGAIYCSGGNCTILNSNFTANVANGDAIGGNGGAVALTDSLVKVYNCNFVNNHAFNLGGATYLQKNENITVEHSIFNNNIAEFCGGAITWFNQSFNGGIYHTVFTNNIAQGSGGAIYRAGEGGTLFNTTYTNNKALGLVTSTSIAAIDSIDGDGGAIYWDGDNSHIINALITNNIASDDGGAIFWQGSNSNIYNITCLRNVGISGKDRSGYQHNSKGGSICLTGSNVILSKSTFQMSSAAVDGGAIYLTGNNVTIKESEFSYCNVTYDARKTDKVYGGGCIYVIGNDTKLLDCTFFRANANKGGIIYVEGNNALIDNADCSYCIVAIDGGVFYIAGDNATISNTHVKYTNATLSGGAVYIDGFNATIKKFRF